MQPAQQVLCEIVLSRAGDHAKWIEDQLAALGAGAPERELHIFLGLAPRRLGKADLNPTAEERAAADAARPGWSVGDWSIDGAARVLALLSYSGSRPFAEIFKDLRRTADVAELIALYRGLPLYPEPQALAFEAGEGLRSNMRAVFEAVAHHSPYPRDNFDQHRWNHMVLKALFVGSRLAPIVGLDERANPELAGILRDYAHERWAAGRPVSPELWRCVGPFVQDEAALMDLQRALRGEPAERAAAALALSASPAVEAAALLDRIPDLKSGIAEGRIAWKSLDAKEAA